jgi:hypothetical protein
MTRLIQYRAPQIIAATALPKEIITLYSDDSDEMKLAMRGFWQSLHVHARCWLLAEPLDQYTNNDQDDTLYKCRFSSSSSLLVDSHSSFVFLLPKQQVQALSNAPVQPVEWEVITDQDGNECPVNVFGWDRALWQSAQLEQSTESSPTSSLEKHKDRVAVDPVDLEQEEIAFTAIIQATLELLPDLPDDGYPSRRDMPTILLMAAHNLTLQKLNATHDYMDCQSLKHRVEDISSMLDWKKVWWWDRERFVEIVPTPISEQEVRGTCLVNIGIHPEVRKKTLEALGLKGSEDSNHQCAKKHVRSNRSKIRNMRIIA